jgi:hypothetical protein
MIAHAQKQFHSQPQSYGRNIPALDIAFMSYIKTVIWRRHRCSSELIVAGE